MQNKKINYKNSRLGFLGGGFRGFGVGFWGFWRAPHPYGACPTQPFNAVGMLKPTYSPRRYAKIPYKTQKKPHFNLIRDRPHSLGRNIFSVVSVTLAK
jgi:hypothetical protein